MQSVTLALPEPGAPEYTVAQPIAGRYRVEGVFFAGRSGVLLRATDLRTRREVLVKALRTDAAAVPTDVPDRLTKLAGEWRRLRHELQTERRLLVRLRNAGCAGVPHPNDFVYDRNPALTEAGLDPAFVAAEPFLVLQKLAGVTLEALLAERFSRGMPERVALALIRPAVRVLAALHEPWTLARGRVWHCVYQDFKPANVLVDPAGRATVLDFGGCQVVVDGVPVLEGGFTPGYAPPECLRPGPPRVLGPDADVYGIGATLYHLLTGADPRDLLARHRGAPGAHLDPADLPRGVSPGLRALVGRCLAARPSDRPASARVVAQALDDLPTAP